LFKHWRQFLQQNDNYEVSSSYKSFLTTYNLVVEIDSASSHGGGSNIGATYNHVIETDSVNNHSGGSDIEATYNLVV